MKRLLPILMLGLAGCALDSPVRTKMASMDPYAAQVLKERRDEAARPTARTRYFDAHPSLDPKIKFAMQHGSYLVGMDQEQVYLSLGPATTINHTFDGKLKHDQWIYHTKRTFLYFDEGLLTSWRIEDPLEQSFQRIANDQNK